MHSVWTAWFQFWNKQHHLRIDVLFFCCIFNEQRIQWVQLDRQKKASKYNDTYLHHRISRAPLMRQSDRHLKLKQNWQPYSERTTRRIQKQMGYSSRRQHRVLFLSAKNRRRRLQFTQAHQNWAREDWKNAVWSDESRFLLRHSDGRVRIWGKEHESIIIIICYILYSAFLGTRALYIVRGVLPHTPPVCSIHLDDATAAILYQNANHTPAY